MAKKRAKKLHITWTKKRKIWTGVGAAVLALFLAWVFFLQGGNSAETAVTYDVLAVQDGNVASSTLLSGQVKADQEQYVYYESSKGSTANVLVAVGDQVSVGQQLVQYDATTAQAAYDTAVRNVNKITRQINYLKTYGNLPTTETSTDAETGETTTSTVQPSAQQNASYNQQLADLNDSLADAQSEVTKAQETLNQTVVTSDVTGTVVEVNNNVDPNSKDSQVMVHITTQGQFNVQGTLTEYDLPNVHVGQSVTIKSKVYSDRQWTGTISSISDYPNQTTASGNNSGATTGTTSSGGSTYNYTVSFTGDVTDIKQGFNVSLEVNNNTSGLVVPVAAITTEGDQSYVWVYDQDTKTVKKRQVTLGNADATNQIVTGIDANSIVLATADDSLQDGDTVTVNDSSLKSAQDAVKAANQAASSQAASSTENSSEDSQASATEATTE